mmetsp:Transcript_29164/g.62500  ORF Transcript_29164/g.62500 Transcript_29164/m.62500 type:complete len:326 (+) Transcript_29164:121-1098(+)
MFMRFSISIVFPFIFILSGSVVGARSPHFHTRLRSPNCLYHGCHKLKRRNVFPVSTLSDDGVVRLIPLNHRQQTDHEHSAVQILQRLRGGDTTSSASPCKVSLLIELLDIFGTAIFAFSGALKAGKKGMDMIGMMIIASITAVGGGTLRDILMMGGGKEHVVFWMETPLYLEISLITALATFFWWPKLETKFGLEADSAVPICTADALGLAAFCVVGVQAAAKRGLAPTLWVVSGLMTATFGGIVRDVICGDRPRIMYPHRTLYALGPALGALTYTVLDHLVTSQSLQLNDSSITLISFLVAFLVRVLSFNKPWRMPHWNVKTVE